VIVCGQRCWFFDRLTKERLGGLDIALGAQPEVDRPARPINGTI
jgi:hypothetical protein